MSPSSLWRRFTAEWKIKVFLGGVITGAFWFGYFLLERLPAGSVTPMPELTIDRMIRFQPGAAFIYVSQFATMPLMIWLMTSRRQLFACCRGLALLIGISFIVFYFWPTSVTRPVVLSHQHFFFDLVAGADLPRNACPSLHAAFGVFTAGCAWEVFRGWTNGKWFVGGVWLWTAAVLASTLLIKQHVFLDLLAGSALGAMGWWSMSWQPKRSSVRSQEGPELRSRPAVKAMKRFPEDRRCSQVAGTDAGTRKGSFQTRV
jgi:membrane-associated phospholipid phosphatase